jgi:hypothetical protein
LKTRLHKFLVAIAIIVAIGIAASALTSWLARQALVASIRPASEFDLAILPTAPDYSATSAWAVTPDEPGLSLLTPGTLPSTPPNDAAADVFFVHPTTYFGKDNWNANLDNIVANNLLDNMVVPSQVSVFNACCRIFAPRYRQATFYVFLDVGASGHQALDIAYQDVRDAFEHYMAVYNDGRPFILASHSQGTLHAIRLLEDVIAESAYRDRLIAAYLPGFSLPLDKLETTLQWLPPCSNKSSVRCLLAWDTYGEKGGPRHRDDRGEHYYADADSGHWERRAGKTVTCVNPLSWTTDRDVAGKKLHAGATYVVLPGIGNLSLLPTLATLIEHDLSARCDEDGFLYISKPTSPVFDLAKMPGESYHNYDYGLFYKNIRDNAVERVNAFIGRE